MENLSFGLSNFGAFDYYLKKSGTVRTPRQITHYEFEFYTENCPGGLRNDGVLYPAQKGGCCLSKPGQIQEIVKPYRGYYFNVVTQDPELCEMLDNLPGFFIMWNVSEVIDLIKQMVSTEDSGLMGRLKLQSCACRILAILSRYRTNPKAADSGVYQHRKTLLMADKYLRENMTRDVNLLELAKLCSLDPTYFHKLYTAAFGQTPAQRHLGFRITAAKTALLEGKVSIADVAARCGFSSQTYFSYRFKKATGKTPAQYRREMLSNSKN
ncbi:MAG: helix-turn-helix transcriptional regulator [Oscillospiraceae bacterium]|nr:helix-turn-helix transcriptional regulator [Oscillospiraceae bacterium]